MLLLFVLHLNFTRMLRVFLIVDSSERSTNADLAVYFLGLKNMNLHMWSLNENLINMHRLSF